MAVTVALRELCTFAQRPSQILYDTRERPAVLDIVRFQASQLMRQNVVHVSGCVQAQGL